MHLVALLVQQRHHVTQFGDLEPAQRPDRRYEIGSIRILHFLIAAVHLDGLVEQDLGVAEGDDRSLIGLPEEFLRFLARFD